MSSSIDNTLDLNNPNAIKLFKSIIQELIQKEIRNAPFNKMIPATVKSVALDGTLTVQIMDDSIDVDGILNRTGETIIANDKIWILKINNSNSNIVATLKQ